MWRRAQPNGLSVALALPLTFSFSLSPSLSPLSSRTNTRTLSHTHTPQQMRLPCRAPPAALACGPRQTRPSCCVLRAAGVPASRCPCRLHSENSQRRTIKRITSSNIANLGFKGKDISQSRWAAGALGIAQHIGDRLAKGSHLLPVSRATRWQRGLVGRRRRQEGVVTRTQTHVCTHTKPSWVELSLAPAAPAGGLAGRALHEATIERHKKRFVS